MEKTPGKKVAYLGIDQGSTATKALLVSAKGELLFSSRKMVKTKVSGSAVHQDPKALLRSVRSAISEAVSFARKGDITVRGAGIATQRSSFLFFDESAQPLTPIISWRDTSGAERIPALLSREEKIRQISGLPLTPYYSALKLEQHAPPGRGTVRFGTVNTFLIFALTGGKVFATDPANAQRTLLFDIHGLDYSEELLRCFSVPGNVRLPEIKDTVSDFGHISVKGSSIPILSSTGDQQAALCGSTGWRTGRGLINLGTGGFLLVPVGELPKMPGGLIVTLSHSIGGKSFYLLEGTVNAVSDTLGFFEELMGTRFREKEIKRGVYPAVVFGGRGTGAPLWDPPFHAAVSGIGSGAHRKKILASSLLGSLCYFRLIDEAMARGGWDAGEYVVSGGITSIDGVSSFLKDLLGKRVYQPRIPEMTGIGAALSGRFLAAGEMVPARKGNFHPVKGKGPVDAEAYYAEWLRLYHFARQRVMK
ncbi:MAG: hypothetical protein GTN70_07880 [Deltaproteobacteria bacterium]|nr:hypothetical protein [Deltaproteobacteria bacterium]NIS77617.1 hypothetical protein [Deltaproteobacteria bacterium]